MRGALAVAASVFVAVAFGGCVAGGPDAEGPNTTGTASPTAGPLTVAVINLPGVLDPLRARTRSEHLIARQIYEPLVDRVSSPFGRARVQPGLTRGWRSSADKRRWFFTLRTGVRFQDGVRFNGAAVVANANRWQDTARGRELLPGLLTADAPRTDFVRMSFAEPVPDLPERMGSGRLGLVSPASLGRAVGGEAAGTGPFELRERNTTGVVLARNTDWWGSGSGLGPTLNQIEFVLEPLEGERLVSLRDGTVDVADGLRADTRQIADSDPLLGVSPGGGRIGFALSVKGIDSSNPDQSLSDVWLSTVRG